MGAKTRLMRGFIEDRIGALLERPRRGARAGELPLLVDAFAGTGIVGAAFARRARVVAADAQQYAVALARSLLLPLPAGEGLPDPDIDLGADVDRARAVLEWRYGREIEEERRLLEAPDADGPAGIERYRAWLEGDGAPAAAPEAEAEALPAPRPIATALYRNVYFGVRQAVEIDALRDAIAGLEIRGEEMRDASAARRAIHYLAALLFAASKATSGTSHFAQPRGLAKDSEVRAVMRRRRQDVGALFRQRALRLGAALLERPPLPGSRADDLDYGLLFVDLHVRHERPSVVYADPPYTLDQYSRFYHALEVLTEREAPGLARGRDGRILKGRYPALVGRHQSRFCIPEHVEGEFRRVTEYAARSGASIVWSYSATNGLLIKSWAAEILAAGATDPEAAREQALARLEGLIGEFYRSVNIERRRLRHSGSGDKNHDALEILAIGDRPR
jgi:adenine-specific DNA-methyltransferase